MFISNKCSFKLSIHQSVVSTKTLIVFNSDNQILYVSCASNHHIRMISEGSCDTENLSNDDDKFSFDNRNKLHAHI